MRHPIFLVLLASVLTGCGDSGPEVYHISGEVTFQGQPVPSGRVYFSPDGAQGNHGPQGYADIADGTFDTRLGGRGTTGGAMIVKIEGFTGPPGNPEAVGRPLFAAHEVRETLPGEECTRNFDVPASAAQGLPTEVGPLP